jgi:hypothetical protein
MEYRNPTPSKAQLTQPRSNSRNCHSAYYPYSTFTRTQAITNTRGSCQLPTSTSLGSSAYSLPAAAPTPPYGYSRGVSCSGSSSHNIMLEPPAPSSTTTPAAGLPSVNYIEWLGSIPLAASAAHISRRDQPSSGSGRLR